MIKSIIKHIKHKKKNFKFDFENKNVVLPFEYKHVNCFDRAERHDL